MRAVLISALALSALAVSNPSLAQVKKIPYQEVKVNVSEPIQADAALESMRKAFVDAVAKKDVEALSALVGPTFVWLSQNSPSEEFDMGRDAIHNFKVAFGFRDYGQDNDGPVPEGPYWDKLAAFAADGKYNQDVGNLICGPITGSVQDDAVLAKAKKKIGDDDSLDWYFTLAETAATAAPGGGATVGKVGTIALPILSTHPKGAEDTAITHLEVLLPSGKSGWIPSSAARSFVNDSLCYARTAKGEWKIAAFDQAAE
jgi:ketosteroid isomerase-like protein